MSDQNDDGVTELCNGGVAVISPTKDGGVLAGFYTRGIPGTGRMAADEWDAFVAAGNRALGRTAKERRPITHADAAIVQVRAAAACNVRTEDVEVAIESDGSTTIIVNETPMFADEVHALARAGIHAGRNGWEIEA